MTGLLVGVGVWLMCAITAAVIAGGKGRSSGGWLLLGLVIGVFAVVMVACLPALDPEAERAKREALEAKLREPMGNKEFFGWLLLIVGILAFLLLLVVVGT